jgi:hypothetical protein
MSIVWWVSALWTGVASAAPSDPEAFARVLRALSARDPVACETVEALSPTPAATLLEVVDTVQMPPWAPMIAAQCLLRHFPTDVRSRLDTWVTDPELAGFGRLTLDALDTLPVEIAVPVARTALKGSDPALAKQRISASTRPEVRAVVTP